MAWINNGSNEYCKESYSLQVDSDSTKGTLYVSLKMDGSVQISYNDKYISEGINLGVDEDGSSKILNKHSHQHSQNVLLIENYIMMGKVPSVIYENRRHLLEIGSGDILKAIYDFAINDIEEMEKNREIVDDFMNKVTAQLNVENIGDDLMSKYGHLLEENN